jgi:hypothetical protein
VQVEHTLQPIGEDVLVSPSRLRQPSRAQEAGGLSKPPLQVHVPRWLFDHAASGLFDFRALRLTLARPPNAEAAGGILGGLNLGATSWSWTQASRRRSLLC